MASFVVHGGLRLDGCVRASGAKNATLPIMAATLLSDAPIELLGAPHLTDVCTMAQLLRKLGMSVKFDARETETVMRIKPLDTAPVRADSRLVRRMRAGFCLLGPLLAKRGRAEVPMPGGCDIGDRPVDLHLRGLAALGARISLQNGCVVATAHRLRGANIDLTGPRGPTVTGTANVLSAAALARGTTVIRGAAREPEVVDLGHFLISLGARIEGLGTSTLEIEGVDHLTGGCYRVIPDRIEAATLLMAGAITGGSVQVDHVIPSHLDAVLSLLHAAGTSIEIGPDWVRCTARRRLQPVDIVAEPYPGFPTDLQAQWTALMSVASGPCRLEDRVFPGRLRHVAELRRLGAEIDCSNGVVCIAGRAHLANDEVRASDLRASAALILAALTAHGTSVIRAIEHLDRGYERLERKLSQLGARMERISGQANDDQRLTDELSEAHFARFTGNINTWTTTLRPR